MDSLKNITRFTYEATSFQGWRLAISRQCVNYIRYFSDREYGNGEMALEEALCERDRVYEILSAHPEAPGKALAQYMKARKEAAMPVWRRSPRKTGKQGKRFSR